MTQLDHATTVASLLEASATLPGEARLRFLQRACGGDSLLIAEVESLLDALGAGTAPTQASTAQTGLVSRERVHHPLRVPDVLAGRYRIRSQLGVGGMAVVYLADDETLRRSVAIKIQRPDIIRHGGRERFDDEIRLTANLRHPNIVPLFDCGEADGFSFFVMPHIAGETLRDHLARVGTMTVEDAMRVANDVLAALQYAHNAGIVHRDVKPSNIMLESGRAMLADFGIANAMEADAAAPSSAGSGAGTPAYMSPEQAARSIHVGRASDIYSTGCTLYEMLTGVRPTRAASRMALASTAFDSWAKERATLIAIAPAACDVIERAVALDPTHRFASAAEFGRALTDAVTPSAPPPPAVDMPATGQRTATRWRWRPVVAASAVLGTIALVSRFAQSVQSRGADASQVATASPITLDTTRVLILPYEYDSTVHVRLTGTDRFPDAVARWRGITVTGLSRGAATDSGAAPDSDAAPYSYAWSKSSKVADSAFSLNAGRCIRRQVTMKDNQFVIRATLLDALHMREIEAQTLTVTGPALPPDSTLQRLADRLMLSGVPDSLRTGLWIGTTSRSALTQFARGIGPLDSLELVEADSAFRAASTLDTTYARAALWVALVRIWQDAPREAWASYVSRAQTGRASLSPRDARALPILLRLASGDSAGACTAWQQIAAQDDTYFESWFSAARCMLADSIVVRDARGASGWRFRSSLGGAARAIEHALALNPHVALTLAEPWSRSLASLFLVYSGGVRSGIAPAESRRFLASAVWDVNGDSVRLVPYEPGAEPEISPELHARSALYLRDELRRLARKYFLYHAVQNAGIAVSYARDATGIGDPVSEARGGLTFSTERRRRLRTAIPAVWLVAKHSLPDSLRSLEAIRFLADSVLRVNPMPAPREAAALASLAVLLGRFDLARSLLQHSNDTAIRPEALAAELKQFLPTRTALSRIDSLNLRRELAQLLAEHRHRRIQGIPPTSLVREAGIRLALGDTTRASKSLADLLDSLPSFDIEAFRSPIELAALMRSIATYTAIGSRTEADRQRATRWALALRTLWTGADRSLQPLLDRLASTATQSSAPN